MDVDLLVIGSGPAGYHAAIRGAQLGLGAAVAEREAVGGVCLNTGCIPTRTLLHATHKLGGVRRGRAFGFNVLEWNLDLGALNRHRERTVQRLSGGVRGLLHASGVEVLRGSARLTGPNSARVGDRHLSFRHCVVATGSRPGTVPGLEIDHDRIVDSSGALRIEEVPRRFLAIGAGAVGLEFATIYNRLGSAVRVVDVAGRIAPRADEEVSARLAAILRKQGIALSLATRTLGAERKGDEVHVELESLSTGARRVETYDRVLVGVGRVPNSEDLGLEELGVRRDGRRFIEVNWHLETNRPNLYAVGDVTGDPMFAHKAMRQGLVAAERCAGRNSAMDAVAVPGYVYTIPEVAWVGPTEQELRADGASLRVGRLPLGASARAVTSGAEDGFVKVIADAATDLVLAVHACAPNAGDVIGEAALAIEMGAVVDDIAQTVHPHPTLSELLLEGAEAVRGRAIHYPALNITAERKKAAQARESIPRRAGAG